MIVPLLLTMLISGLWHGAGYGFIVWGLLSRSLSHNQPCVAPDQAAIVGRPDKLWTLYAATGSDVDFHISSCVDRLLSIAPTITSAIDVLRGLIGLNGIALPQEVYNHLGPLANWLHQVGVTAVSPDLWSGQEFTSMALWIIASMFIALACPNTLQILSRYEPALGVKPQPIYCAGRRLFRMECFPFLGDWGVDHCRDRHSFITRSK